MKRFAFTLAEVLITLGIVGVVAALTIPNLIQNYKKQQTIAQFKQMYSIIDQVLLSISNEGIDLYSKDWLNNKDEIAEIISEYFKVTKRYTSADALAAAHNTGYETICIDYKNPVGFPKKHPKIGYRRPWQNGMEPGYNGSPFREASAFVILNGACIAIGRNEWEQKTIIVDLNGNQNGPNRIGHDTFFFYLGKNNRLTTNTPANIDINNECSNKYFNDSYGRYCANRIIKDGYKINYW